MFAVIIVTASLLPNRASAFWPFSTNADAAVGASIPNSSTPRLQAPVNSNPNSSAPIALDTSDDSALIAHGGPGGTTADVVGTTPPDHISVYVVRENDTLSVIAKMFNVSVNTIIWANNLSGAGGVHAGDTLVILPVSGVERVVVKGDTLKSIAKKYGGDSNEIAQYNGLNPATALIVGSTVIIPGGEVAPSSSVSHGNSTSGIARNHSRKIKGEPYLGGGGSVQPGYYSNPVPGGVITQGIHGWNGVDIGAARGTPIYAAADGTAIVSRSNGGWNGGYGNYVVITHDNGSQTLYSHMKHAIVSPGQSVSTGQLIGYVGSTGDSTGPHLHFEVRGAANPLRDCSVGSVCEPE